MADELPPYADRFFAKVEKTESCWNWTAYRCRGYGTFSVKGRSKPAHRVSYEMLVGPIPDGLVIDHLCRNPSCVNPAHLEPVTPRENVVRGVGPALMSARCAAQTHCHRGHEFTPENTRYNGKLRNCRTCHREAARLPERKAKHRDYAREWKRRKTAALAQFKRELEGRK